MELEAELAQAKAERAIKIERAEAAKAQNDIFAESVTPEYVQYRTLEVLEAMAENGNAVFIPMEAISALGVQQRMFAQKRME